MTKPEQRGLIRIAAMSAFLLISIQNPITSIVFLSLLLLEIIDFLFL